MNRYVLLAALSVSSFAQQKPTEMPREPLGNGPFIYDTAEQHKIKVTVLSKALNRPFGMAFLPDGNILVSERGGTLRIFRDGVLDPQPMTGIPAVNTRANAGLYDFVLHPKFAENRWVYFAYSKLGANGDSATTLARGKLERSGLTEVKDLYSTEMGMLVGGSRIVFAQDGTIYLTTAAGSGNSAQDPASAYGKVLRLKDDGTIPADNPFVGKAGYRPEIYTLGHRDHLGLVVHSSGAIFNAEHGPNGGDEVNWIKPGRNYGWPTVSFGRQYDGTRVSETPQREGFELPQLLWIPSIGPSGITFYTGDRFPAWKGNLFIGSAQYGEIHGTGRLERVVLNERFEDIRHEALLTDLHQRVRDVRQGPDGFLYVLTDQETGALLRIEPVQ